MGAAVSATAGRPCWPRPRVRQNYKSQAGKDTSAIRAGRWCGPPVAYERLCPFARQLGGTETALGLAFCAACSGLVKRIAPERPYVAPVSVSRRRACEAGRNTLYRHHRLCKHNPATAVVGRQPVSSWCAWANSRHPGPNIPARGSRPGGRVSCGAVRRVSGDGPANSSAAGQGCLVPRRRRLVRGLCGGLRRSGQHDRHGF
jgi:hypothetical protein